MLRIHDIKPIVKIPDVSIYIYYGLILFLVLLFCVGIYMLYNFLKPKEKSQEVVWYEQLQTIELSNSKAAAYKISKYGKLLAKDKRQLLLINELIDDLSSYKYKKVTPEEFSEETQAKFNIFMDSLNVR